MALDFTDGNLKACTCIGAFWAVSDKPPNGDFMSITFKKSLLITILGVIAFQIPGRAVDIDVPVLAVHASSDGKLEGGLYTCTVTITNRKVEKPLAVSVTEDSPSAIGAQMRAAVWLAATTVALERGAPLTGYRIDISFDGSFDGPSAGGVIALALMSALDNRTLPTDFAFTGTILPNGGVGQVGGVIQKIQAAAKAGKKRVLVPNFYRVDTDPLPAREWTSKISANLLGLNTCRFQTSTMPTGRSINWRQSRNHVPR
jgi:predicted S18 family serine protease